MPKLTDKARTIVAVFFAIAMGIVVGVVRHEARELRGDQAISPLIDRAYLTESTVRATFVAEIDPSKWAILTDSQRTRFAEELDRRLGEWQVSEAVLFSGGDVAVEISSYEVRGVR